MRILNLVTKKINQTIFHVQTVAKESQYYLGDVDLSFKSDGFYSEIPAHPEQWGLDQYSKWVYDNTRYDFDYAIAEYWLKIAHAIDSMKLIPKFVFAGVPDLKAKYLNRAAVIKRNKLMSEIEQEMKRDLSKKIGTFDVINAIGESRKNYLPINDKAYKFVLQGNVYFVKASHSNLKIYTGYGDQLNSDFIYPNIQSPIMVIQLPTSITGVFDIFSWAKESQKADTAHPQVNKEA